jgi:hypothetical protein
MTRRPRRPRRPDPAVDGAHQRFTDWLVASPSSDPPRDLAVHASSCPECQRHIAAMDDLAAVDLGLAGIPPAPPLAETVGWATAARRAALMAGGVAVVAALMFVTWRTFLAPDQPVVATDPSPTQAVLGGTGSSQPSPSPGGEESLAPTAPESSPSAGATATIPPFIGPLPGQTPFPPVQPTSGPVATLPPGATPQPPPAATPSPQPTRPPTPQPTQPPTPEPTAPPTPEPTARPPTPEPTPVFLAQCLDLADNDGDFFIDWPLDPGCTGPGDDDESDL